MKNKKELSVYNILETDKTFYTDTNNTDEDSNYIPSSIPSISSNNTQSQMRLKLPVLSIECDNRNI